MPTVNETVLFDLMKKYGWEDSQIADYQRFHGLESTGVLTPATARHILAPRFCGYPDRMNLGGQLPRFPNKDITLFVRHAFPGFTLRATQEIVAWAIGQWAQVVDIHPRLVAKEDGATIVIEVGDIDGPFSVLAWSELAPKIPCLQRYDKTEKLYFGKTAQEGPPGALHAGAITCHELGHALGIEHLAAGNLMQPSYSPLVITPQSGDIQEGRKRYGAPAVIIPADPPQDATPGTRKGLLPALEGCLSRTNEAQLEELLQEGSRFLGHLNRLLN